MIKKTIKYQDFNEKEQSKDFYFNFSRGELVIIEMEAVDAHTEGMHDKVNRLINSRNGKEIVALFKEFVDGSYGVRSIDGSTFDKSPEHLKEFKASGAYDELIWELSMNADAGAEFINGIMPANLRDSVQRELAKRNGEEAPNHTPQTARERSEAQMQGFNKKQESSVQVVKDMSDVPNFPAAAPVLEKAPEEDLSALSKDDLIARLQSNG
jgi:hypothetical protein